MRTSCLSCLAKAIQALPLQALGQHTYYACTCSAPPPPVHLCVYHPAVRLPACPHACQPPGLRLAAEGVSDPGRCGRSKLAGGMEPKAILLPPYPDCNQQVRVPADDPAHGAVELPALPPNLHVQLPQSLHPSSQSTPAVCRCVSGPLRVKHVTR